MQGRQQERFAVAALIAVTVMWGSTFVVMKDGIGQMSLWSITMWRWLIASGVLVLLRPRCLAVPRRVAGYGIVIGACSSLGYLFQTVGLLTIDASVSGFITGMFVVLTPLFASVLLRERVDGFAWVGVAMAVVGLGFISLNGFSVSAGAVWTLAGAAMWALQILTIGRWSTAEHSYSIAVYQMLTIAAFFTVGSFVEGVQTPPNGGVWIDILIMAVLASSFAMTVQTWGQTHVDATRAAVIFTMEPVFAGIFGVWLDHDPVTPRIALGAALIFGAMLLSEFGPRKSVTIEDIAEPHLM